MKTDFSGEATKKAIAARLRIAREQAGLSQGQVAKRLGWHRPTISAIESGDRRVLADEVPIFAELYGVSSAWLLGEEDPGQSEREAQISLAARGLKKISDSELKSLVDLLNTIRAGKRP
jgi:transcriptional regulator with XRE-family HTH domain